MKEELERLRAELKLLKESPYYVTYVSIYKQLDRWAQELKERPVAITSSNEDDDTRAFDKVDKYMKSLNLYFDQLELLRQKMQPIDVANAVKEATSEVDEVRSMIRDGKA
jgi:hypothetical protein